MIENLRTFLPYILLVVFALAPLMTLGQTDGSTPPSDVPVESTTSTPAFPAETPARETTSAPALESLPRATGAEAVVPATTTSAQESASAPATPESASAAPATDSTGPADSPQAGLPPIVFEDTATSSAEESDTSMVLWIVLAALAVVPFGFFAAKVIKSKGTQKDSADKKDCKRCFDLQRMLQEKLAELTDLRGKLEGKLKGMARDQIRESVKGTPAESVLAAAEKAEKEYGRLKQIFEECMIEFEKNAFKGKIIENSLKDKKILEKMKIEKTSPEGNRTVHNVLASADTISELSSKLADGPWHAHFWKPGKDGVTVVFRDKVFAIRSSDKTTWGDAIAYGISIGIPEAELDFPTEK